MDCELSHFGRSQTQRIRDGLRQAGNSSTGMALGRHGTGGGWGGVIPRLTNRFSSPATLAWTRPARDAGSAATNGSPHLGLERSSVTSARAVGNRCSKRTTRASWHQLRYANLPASYATPYTHRLSSARFITHRVPQVGGTVGLTNQTVGILAVLLGTYFHLNFSSRTI